MPPTLQASPPIPSWTWAGPPNDRPPLRDLLAGVIDLADRARPPHPGGRPCGSGCVPACAAG